MRIWSPLRLLRERRRRRLVASAKLTDECWREVLESCPIARGFTDNELQRLRDLAVLFRQDKIFEPVDGMVLTESIAMRIALLACLPLMNLDYDWYEDWRTVVVYPGEFVRPRAEMDGIGVMHEWEDVLSGESWERGPVILAAADVAASGLGEGYNVVLHEMAHKLDMFNGLADGFPPLHSGMDRRHWTSAWSAAFADFNGRLDRGESPGIDPYGAESPAEFFAVTSEYFFEQPWLMQAEYPLVYDALVQLYRQDPGLRLVKLPHPHDGRNALI